MKALRLFCLLALTCAPATLLADQVTCESRDNREAECNMDTSSGVRLVRQLSDTRCVEGQNWGINRHSIWVDGGCRAVFESNRSSNSSHSTGSTLPNHVTCESVDHRRVECDMDTRGEVRMVRKLSDASCVEGQSWGLNKHSVWVENGCRAVFESDGTGPVYDNDPAYGGRDSNNAGGVPTAYIRACNAVEDNYGQVVSSTPLKPGHWEVILEYSDGQYVCNVGPGGDVTYFEKLRR